MSTVVKHPERINFKNVETGKVILPREAVKMALPVWNMDMMKEAGWYPLYYGYLEYDPDRYDMIPNGDPILDNIKKEYTQTFKLEAVSAEETTNRVQMRTEARADFVRKMRDDKLAEVDYMAMPDYPLNDTDKADLTVYRQALRDITKKEGFPWLDGEIEWPITPSFMNKE